MFAGFGIGPMFGGIIVRTTGTALSVFYIAAGMHVLHSIMVWFIIPESLSSRRQLVARKLKTDKEDAAKTQTGRNGAIYWLSKAFGFLAPLALFYPAIVESNNTNPLKRRKRDWNLLLVATSYGTTILLMVWHLLFELLIQSILG
jgi:heme/copper-type cytochrome/quinol oxidase subunit 3